MISKFKDFLNDPFGFLIHHNSIFDFRMLLVAQRCVSTDALTGSVLCTKRSLYFTAGVLGKPFISQPRIKNDGLCFDISDKIVVDVNVAFFVIVHGIAFADLNFLNQAHQRGTV